MAGTSRNSFSGSYRVQTPKTPQRALNGRMPRTCTMEVDADEAASEEAVVLDEGEVEAKDIGRG